MKILIVNNLIRLFSDTERVIFSIRNIYCPNMDPCRVLDSTETSEAFTADKTSRTVPSKGACSLVRVIRIEWI
jgi:hypothetical protein